VVNLPWWKWPFWIKVAGQGLLFWGVWKLVEAMEAGTHPDRSKLLPWLACGLAVYYAGRGLQIAANSRTRRLKREEKAREDD
jgi:hypothetical protein